MIAAEVPPPSFCRPRLIDEGVRVLSAGRGAAGGRLSAASWRAVENLGGSFVWANRVRRASLAAERDDETDLLESLDPDWDPPPLPFEPWFTVQTEFVEAGELELIPPDPEDVALSENSTTFPTRRDLDEDGW